MLSSCPFIPKYFSVRFLKTKTFSYMTKYNDQSQAINIGTIPLSHLLYSNSASCSTNILYSKIKYFFLVQ